MNQLQSGQMHIRKSSSAADYQQRQGEPTCHREKGLADLVASD
jgi:hypothetical protein